MSVHSQYDDETPKTRPSSATTRSLEAATIRSLERRSQFLALGLAVVTLLLVVLGAVGLLLYSQEQKARKAEASRRAAELEHDVSVALNDAKVQFDQGKSVSDQPDKWRPLLVAASESAKRAEGLLKAGDAKEEQKQKAQALRAELDQAQKSLELLAKLDDIRLRDSDLPGSYARAFKDFGADVRILDPALSAKKLQLLSNRDAVLDRILDWADATTDAGERRHLYDTVKGAAPDPSDLKDIAKAKDDQDKAALMKIATERDLPAFPPRTLCRLAVGLQQMGAEAEAEKVLRKGQQRNPQDFWIALTLGSLLQQRDTPKDRDDALRFLTAAAALKPPSVILYNRLGLALRAVGDLDGAIDAYLKALDCDRDNVPVLNNLGFAYLRKGDVDDAVQRYEEAIRIDPKRAESHINMGDALRTKGDLAGAALAFRKALEINDKLATAHTDLGLVYAAQGEIDLAIAEHEKALVLEPKSVKAHNNLGDAQLKKGDVEEALQTFQKALEIDQRFPQTHLNIGTALLIHGDVEGAIHSYQRAVELDPSDSVAQVWLGWAYWVKGDSANAARTFRTALDLNPKAALAYIYLGNALVEKGQLAEAVNLLKDGITKVDPKDPLLPEVKRNQADYQAWFTTLDARLQPILNGEDRPTGSEEQISLARMCQHYKHLYVNAAVFYGNAFDKRPELADVRTHNRLEAACAAVLAGTAQGEDNASLSDRARLGWRERARGWLEEDLAQWAKIASSGKWADRQFVRAGLLAMKQERDLSAVRNKDALQKLTESERALWQKFWEDVDALLNQLKQKK
jgi:tetratricopeptide (TPR) repeat protein